MSRRVEQLELIARNFIKIHDEWSLDANRPNPDEIYWDAASEVVQAFETGDIPGDIRPLADAANKFADEVDAFDDRADESRVYPKEGFWLAVEGLRKAVNGPKRRELPPLETIKELAALPYMQHVQIARMYGFIDRRGNPMPGLVQKELDTPGCVIAATKGSGMVDGRDWVDPRIAELDNQDGVAERAVAAIESTENASKQAQERKGRRAKKEDAPCPETIEQLWEQGVGAPQAARMLQRGEVEVAKQFAAWDEAKVFTGRVYELADKSVPMGEICKQLRTDPKRVEGVLKERPTVATA